jgi:uncharacterized heparinase superfamily protein
LAAFQGGEELERAYVAAARAKEEDGDRPVPVARNGYHRLEGGSLQVCVDAAAPSLGDWSVAACAQPLAIEVLCGRRRLIVGGGWSPDAHAPQAMRLADAASTGSIERAACGEPLRGFAGRTFGTQLKDAVRHVRAQRRTRNGELWMVLAHDGWVERFGLSHERRLYLSADPEELRGEDSFVPVAGKRLAGRFAQFVVRFHLHPDVQAQIAADRTSVLLRFAGEGAAWWLRNDAIEVGLEPSVHYRLGQGRRSQQVVLRGQARADKGGRVRWKLSPADRVDEVSGAP